MPGRQWQWGVQYPNGLIECFSSKKDAKAHMLPGDKLKRRFVGKWKKA